MIPTELLTYVSDCRAKGLGDDEIRGALAGIGWNQSDIDQALSHVSSQPSHSLPPTGAAGISGAVSVLNGPFPPELKGWNIGAFGLPLFWGLSHKIWWSLLSLINPLGLIVAIVLGIQGNEMAWNRRKFKSI